MSPPSLSSLMITNEDAQLVVRWLWFPRSLPPRSGQLYKDLRSSGLQQQGHHYIKLYVGNTYVCSVICRVIPKFVVLYVGITYVCSVICRCRS